MPATAEQQALYDEHFPARTDGGKPFTVEDLLHQLKQFQRGINPRSDEWIAELWGTPLIFVKSLKRTAKKK